MGVEINLLENYPHTQRDISGRLICKTKEDQKIACQFGKEFFDGSRNHGYGGFYYNARFWKNVVPAFQQHWNLINGDSVLDIGCAKGFMIYDMQLLIQGLQVSGIDISEYAIDNAKEEVKNFCKVANATDLPFADKSIDVSISITTLHNLEEKELVRALLEIERVTKRGSFITLDAYRNNEERDRMEAWNLTAKTVMHVDEW
ncbi:MAG: class I SAM-dependent methyltransferase, partial [Gammaproteobacteria bacterium]|nr:class I SAM-dependent methyltransferase [Gammaproteobacteria bacterium]